ncbi:helix-turn-helix domain-containing protein [Chitinophaga rhizophila]|uniref:Helix-turn-helix domain-containing protein n=1 Tax=Chitinophaga rhizophila TaxID=2866212 RepID=A0ABS7GEX3_9BACT|nr:helix-turn-helix domain-containing protein [Chitinophaga rhizophila]MBW8685217.1 helix-turn-helix domain-containing protein [Chitinophaga rhizophila]
MKKITESLTEFYKHKFNGLAEELQTKFGHFNVFRIEEWVNAGSHYPAYIRRDFYKIMLFSGTNVFHYGDKSIPVSGNTLLFFNPKTPYTSEPLSAASRGYYCIFDDEFFRVNHRLNLNDLPLFKSSSRPVFSLTDDQSAAVQLVFEKMLQEASSDYIYKYELIKNYVSELIYSAIKLQPSVQELSSHNAGSRIYAVFLELLERQFPITATSQRFAFRSPKIIADSLAVHVNHLNRAIKSISGRTTTDHITERLISEAKTLLNHTDWNIGEISYVLGFENQAQFNVFFKKHTRTSPTSFRKVSI